MYIFTTASILFGAALLEIRGQPVNSPSDNSPRIRCDYTFFKDAQGWFKLHARPATWHDAQAVCHSEGSSFLYPANEVLMDTALHLMTDASISTIHTSMTVKLESVTLNEEGVFLRAGLNDSFPFICKYKVESLLLNECGTVDKDYQFYNGTAHCYKLHKNKANWFKAEAACKAEGGQLAIINSQKEAAVIVDIFKNNPADQIPGHFEFGKGVAFIGFRSLDEGHSWTTINNETLSEAGYAEFCPGEPNNAAGNEYCGSVRRTGKLLDDPCTRELLFICEKKPEEHDN
ncbi:uncharacterized protein LOC113229105 [Hyposmocoma kahamanoa]|uniref:uncharacterized protein LOC113229105 n=1 Tax=Hyposmocoma kahamanoa TaxID=1477025 RepID=UPI000E6D6E7A|nr:uncharacterized protein LOC113229105 [Hyposmocoma kahamanoa]